MLFKSDTIRTVGLINLHQLGVQTFSISQNDKFFPQLHYYLSIVIVCTIYRQPLLLVCPFWALFLRFLLFFLVNFLRPLFCFAFVFLLTYTGPQEVKFRFRFKFKFQIHLRANQHFLFFCSLIIVHLLLVTHIHTYRQFRIID